MGGKLQIPDEVGNRFGQAWPKQRPIVLHQSLKRFPSEIESVKFDVAMFKACHQSQRLSVVVEAAKLLHAPIERCFTGMAERRMTEVVRQRQRLSQVLVQSQNAGHRTGDLGDLEGMRQPCAVIVALVLDEHLCLVLEPPEGRGMDDAIPVALIAGAGWAFFLGPEAAAAVRGTRGETSPFRGLKQRSHKPT